MAIPSYRTVVELARQLPISAQIELAENLLHNVRTRITTPAEAASMLSPLADLNDAELAALAEAVVAPERQQRLSALLEGNDSGSLSGEEQATLDALVSEADQVALLKARALYTVSLRKSVPPSPA